MLPFSGLRRSMPCRASQQKLEAEIVMPRPGDCNPSERLHDIARQTIAHPATSPRMANASISKRAFMIDTPCAKCCTARLPGFSPLRKRST